MRFVRTALILASLSLPVALVAIAEEPSKPKTEKKAEPAEKCTDHGVKKSVCTRCNPKLVPIFKAKGDWCKEHERPETQCVICHPELAKEGVK